MAINRLRVVVIAIRQLDHVESKPGSETSSSPQEDTKDFSYLDFDDWNLKLVGLVGLELNFKNGVQEALSEMKDAKIAVRAVTFD
jgi:magnesium-transporting ATPase (P-type)